MNSLRLQDFLGTQIFHGSMIEIFEPVTKTIKDSLEDVTKTMTKTSKENDNSSKEFEQQFLRYNE